MSADTDYYDQIRQDQERKWEALYSGDQLDFFCAIVRRIVQGEIKDDQSYRGMLYNTLKFGPEAYALAQDAGYIELHNAIYTSSELELMQKRLINFIAHRYPEMLSVLLGDTPDRILKEFNEHLRSRS